MFETVVCHWWQYVTHKREKRDHLYSNSCKSTLASSRQQFTFIKPILPFHIDAKFGLLMFVEFCSAYCLETVSNMAKYICIRMALEPLQCSRLHLESKSRKQCANRPALLPLEDMQERFISSSKALQESKAFLPHKHAMRRTPRILRRQIRKLMMANKYSHNSFKMLTLYFEFLKDRLRSFQDYSIQYSHAMYLRE